LGEAVHGRRRDDPGVGRSLPSADSFLRTFLETTPDIVLLKDREGRIVAASRSFWQRRHGLRIESEALGKTDFDFYSRAFAERVAAVERAILESGEPNHAPEELLVRPNGERLWISWSKFPLLEDGEITGTLTVARDTTERKHADLALGAQTERLCRIVETQRDVAAADDLGLEAVMKLICERTQEVTGAPGASIVVAESDRLVVRCATGFVAGRVGVQMPVDGSFVGWVRRHGKGAIAHDSHTDERFDSLARDHGIRSVVSVPLRHGGTDVAHLQVHSPEPNAFGEQTLHTLELLSVVLSSAVSRATEYEAKREQLEALARFRTIFEAAPIGMARLGLEGRVLEANPALVRMLGYAPEVLAEQALLEFTHPDDMERSRASHEELASGRRDSYRIEMRYVRRDGETIWAQATARLVRDADGAPGYVIAMIEDITKRKAAEEAVLRQARLNEHQALHDSLTGLANRMVFRDRIELAIRRARREAEQVAVLMMDLDRFKEVNDSLGHHAGDRLLQELGIRLEGALRDSDTVARLGGDEFGILLARSCGPQEMREVLRKVTDTVEQPIVLENLPLTIEASIGVAFFPEDGEDVDTLLRHADVAMYLAKEDDASYAFYDPSADTYDPSRLTLVGELRRAIEQRELTLHYQPMAMLASGEVIAVEALLRWHHPERGLIMPDDFIPIAQQTGLMKPLTLYVVDEALRQCRSWLERGIRLPVAVNLSTRNLLDLALPEQIEQLLAKWQLGPELLEVEITESAMLGDPLRSKLVLERLSAIGIRLAIDDFGTGYSSLRHLGRLPFDELKIDRSFVSNMTADEDDATIVRSTIELGRNLGLMVVAEGVETEEHWARLDALGCTVAQGHCVSPPLPPDELELWLADGTRLPLAV
jgi:diguanylate cyclase (GGDEF)-like protein/PAS domain S-box-containing protein